MFTGFRVQGLCGSTGFLVVRGFRFSVSPCQKSVVLSSCHEFRASCSPKQFSYYSCHDRKRKCERTKYIILYI